MAENLGTRIAILETKVDHIVKTMDGKLDSVNDKLDFLVNEFKEMRAKVEKTTTDIEVMKKDIDAGSKETKSVNSRINKILATGATIAGALLTAIVSTAGMIWDKLAS